LSLQPLMSAFDFYGCLLFFVNLEQNGLSVADNLAQITRSLCYISLSELVEHLQLIKKFALTCHKCALVFQLVSELFKLLVVESCFVFDLCQK